MNRMKYGYHMLITLLIVIVQGAPTAGFVLAEEASKSGSGSSTVMDSSKMLVFYRPPRRGAPSTRIGGGSRGPDSGIPRLFVLTPDHTGLTRQEQPTLYWYMSKPVNEQIEFALIDDNTFQIVAEKKLSLASKEGIHGISLKDLGITLETGVPYQWSIAIVIDKDQRSSDVFASGTIERVSKDVVISAPKNGASGEALVSRYAEAGLWYDALDTSARLIEEYPGYKRLVEQRASLLEQVGLVEVATYERQGLH